MAYSWLAKTRVPVWPLPFGCQSLQSRELSCITGQHCHACPTTRIVPSFRALAREVYLDMTVAFEGSGVTTRPRRELVGFDNFVRRNPRSDKFEIRRYDHMEFYTADATMTYKRYRCRL
jgi:hypothetical protein